MSFVDSSMSLGNRKLVVLGIPWDVDTEGLRQYMINYGQLDDVIVMKDRATGRSRGFGYVTFQLPEDAQKALVSQHMLNGRALEVKIATPKEDMRPIPGKKNTRVFVARLAPTVTDDMFRSYFERYGVITDAYMPKDQGSKVHRGIGFITFENPESVDKVMAETHELAGSAIAVDRATPKEETGKYWDKMFPAYGIFSSYINAARFGAFGMPPFGAYDYGGPTFSNDLGGSTGMGGGTYGGGTCMGAGTYGGGTVMGAGTYGGGTGMGAGAYGAGNIWQPTPPLPPGNVAGGHSGGSAVAAPSSNFTPAAPAAPTAPAAPAKPLGKKIFIGRIPLEATVDDVRLYFSDYGRLLDVYLPKDKNKLSHRGFGFVTFAEESAAERVAQRSHELLGHKLAVDRATPVDEPSNSSAFYNTGSSSNQPSGGGAGGPMSGNGSSTSGPGYGSLPSFEYNNQWGSYGSGVGPIPSGDQAGHRASRMDGRYKPY